MGGPRLASSSSSAVTVLGGRQPLRAYRIRWVRAHIAPWARCRNPNRISSAAPVGGPAYPHSRVSTWSELAGRSGRSVKYARIRLALSCASERQPLSMRRPGGRPRVAFGLLGGGPQHPQSRRPLRAYGEARAHIAPSELGAATAKERGGSSA